MGEMSDTPAKKLCFVVGPIGDEGSEARTHADWLLDGIIRPVLVNYPEYQVKRADHDARPGLIDVQMINDLLNADLVIADLSLLNPNAFYEIGIRHMTKKPIIHMQLVTEKPPFDVSLYRAIKFSRTRFSDVEKAKVELKNFVDAVFAPEYQTENPVTNAIGHLKLEQNATPEMRVLMQEIDQLKSQVNMMQQLILPPPDPLDQLRHASLPGAVQTFTLGQPADVFGSGVVVPPKKSVSGMGMVAPSISPSYSELHPEGNLSVNPLPGGRTRGS